MEFIEIEKQDSLGHIILNRPDKKNALNSEMMKELISAFKNFENDDEIKVIIIKGAGDTFCSGADLNWMKEQIQYDFQKNLEESNVLFDLFLTLNNIEKPVVSYVHNYVMGGAIGLAACSDYCFAEENTRFCFSETLMGLAPAVISPFILKKCNKSLVERYMLFAESFSSDQALKMGLVHRTAKQEELLKIFNAFLKQLSALDLDAVKATKKLLRDLNGVNFEDYRTRTTELISKLRVSLSAQERLKSFLEKKNK